MHDFPVYIFICPPYSLPKPATEAKSASSFILSRPHSLLEGARFETAESHSFLLAPIQRVDDEHSETEGASAKIKKILTSFQKPQSPVIYVVEEHERAAALTEAAPYISQMRIRNDPMERQIQKRVPPSCPHLFRKGKNQYKLKTYRETQDSRKSLQGRNDGKEARESLRVRNPLSCRAAWQF